VGKAVFAPLAATIGYDGAMLLRNLIGMAARRAASDPKVRAKARELAETHGRPVVERTVAGVKQAAREAQPGTHPARVAGRAFKKLLDG
jgi:hypothetical protein